MFTGSHTAIMQKGKKKHLSTKISAFNKARVDLTKTSASATGDHSPVRVPRSLPSAVCFEVCGSGGQASCTAEGLASLWGPV